MTNFKTNHHHNTLTIIQQNVRKSCIATNELKEYLQSHQADIIILQEPHTFHSKPTFSQTTRNYHHNNNDEAIFTTTISLNTTLQIQLIDSFSNHFCTTTRINTITHPIIISNFYIHPKSFDNTHISFINKLLSSYHQYPIILTGDFNARNTLWEPNKSNSNGNKLRDIINQHNLTIHNNTDHTCYTPRGSSIIDLTITNHQASTLISKWHTKQISELSDHTAIIFYISTYPTTNTFNSNRLYNENKADWNCFLKHIHTSIQTTPTSSITDISSLTNNIQTLQNIIINAAHASMPKYHHKRYNVPKCTYWNQELNLIKTNFKYARNRYYNEQNVTLKNIYRAEYVKIRNKYNKTIRKYKNANWKNFIAETNNNNPWGNAYKIYKNQSRISTNIQYIDNALDPSTASADLIDKLFPDDLTSAQLQSTIVTSSTITPVSEDEVCGLISQIKSNKSPGPDHITPKMIKKAKHLITPILTQIYNSCLNLQHFPSPWKTSNLIILRKPNKPDPMNHKSYRPICLFPVLGKLLEKIITARLAFNFNTNQHGFTKHKSTITALNDLINKTKLLRKQHIAIISFDFAGAFDNAHWPTIIQNLKDNNTPNYIINIIISYLYKRKITLKYNNHSVNKCLSKGCPQGGVLSPKLWNICVNPALSLLHTTNCQPLAYADDITLICHHNNPAKLKQIIEEQISIFIKWSKDHNLPINPSKTQFITFSKTSISSIITDNITINKSKTIKTLGITIEPHRRISKLTFNKHAANQIAKVTDSSTRLLNIIKHNIAFTQHKRIILYKALFRSLVLYASEVWLPHTTTRTQQLINSLQHRILTKLLNIPIYTDKNVVNYITKTLAPNDYNKYKSIPKSDKSKFTATMLDYYLKQCNPYFIKYIEKITNKSSLLNKHTLMFATTQGPFRDFLHKTGKSTTPLCPCGKRQTSQHIEYECPLITKQTHTDIIIQTLNINNNLFI